MNIFETVQKYYKTVTLTSQIKAIALIRQTTGLMSIVLRGCFFEDAFERDSGTLIKGIKKEGIMVM